MRTPMKKLLLCLLFAAPVVFAQAIAAPALFAQTKTLFYMTDHPDSVRDFMEHQAKIDIIVPTWYNVDPNGMVYGEPDPSVLRVVKQSNMELFPIISIFDNAGVHILLTSDKAQTAMI